MGHVEEKHGALCAPHLLMMCEPTVGCVGSFRVKGDTQEQTASPGGQASS